MAALLIVAGVLAAAGACAVIVFIVRLAGARPAELVHREERRH